MAEAIMPVSKETKTVFSSVVFPPKNLTAKYSGRADITNTNTITNNVVNNADNTILDKIMQDNI